MDRSLLEFSLIDAEGPHGEQCCFGHPFGGVVTTSVIHAAQHLAATMCIVSALLFSERHIIFNEVLVGNIVESVTWGLTEGWWLLADREHRGSFPILKMPQWVSILK